MRIEALWQEMEAEARGGCSAAWLTRLALPQPKAPILIALETETSRRAILLPLPKAAIPARQKWPECRGLEVFSVALDGQAHLGARLRDAACADVFGTLAGDVALRVVNSCTSSAAVAEFLSRLLRWQQFLSAARDGLSPEAQRGLWGELHVLSDHLLPRLKPAVAINAWKGSQAAHQDFQFADGAVEVKTTAAKAPQNVRITSERQLDDTGVGALFLHVVAVDEREVQSGGGSSGQGLADLVTYVRTQVSADAGALGTFNDRLLERGWVDDHAPRYEGRRYTVRKELTFLIGQEFPRLVERDLPDGVGDVAYSLSLPACRKFAVAFEEVMTAIGSDGKRNNPNA